MGYLVGWGLLILVFLGAGEGLNLFRIYSIDWLATGRALNGIFALLGLVLAFFCTVFLGGFVYYRDKKRGKLKREGWLGRPVRKPSRPPREAQQSQSVSRPPD